MSWNWKDPTDSEKSKMTKALMIYWHLANRIANRFVPDYQGIVQKVSDHHNPRQGIYNIIYDTTQKRNIIKTHTSENKIN